MRVMMTAHLRVRILLEIVIFTEISPDNLSSRTDCISYPTVLKGRFSFLCHTVFILHARTLIYTRALLYRPSATATACVTLDLYCLTYTPPQQVVVPF